MKTTGKERITAILAHKPTDRIGVYEAFWPETIEKWREEGHLAAEEPWEDHFDLDIGIAEGLNFKADVNFKDEVVEENEESTLIKDGNGVILKQWKGRSRTPEYHSFLVKDQATYNEHIRSFIKPHENRCGYEAYRKSMARHNKKTDTPLSISADLLLRLCTYAELKICLWEWPSSRNGLRECSMNMPKCLPAVWKFFSAKKDTQILSGFLKIWGLNKNPLSRPACTVNSFYRCTKNYVISRTQKE